MPEIVVGKVTVPTVVGLDADDAIEALALQDLNAVFTGTNEGIILSQAPPAGTDVEPFSAVTLSVEVLVIAITVRATHNGFFGGLYRNPGDTFAISNPTQYSPYWMEFIDTPPDGWVPSLAVYDPAIDREILDF